MSMSQSMLKLVGNSDTNFSKYYPNNVVDELKTFYPDHDNNKIIKIYKLFDSIMEIIINIKLPALPDELAWKDNLICLMIDQIKIRPNTDNGDATLSKEYIETLIKNQSNFCSAKTLFYNLSYNEREKLSRKEINLILPLHIENFIKTPSIILSIFSYGSFIEVNFNNRHLIENSESFILDNIEWSVDILGSHYDTYYRQKLFSKYKEIIHNQTVIKYI